MPAHSALSLPSEHPAWLGLPQLLSSISGLHHLGSAANEADALNRAAAWQPDLILLPEALADRAIFPLVSELRRCCPDSRLVVLAARHDPADVAALLALGLRGYLLWSAVTCASLRADLTAILGGAVLVKGEEVVAALLSALRGEMQGVQREQLQLHPREVAVLRRLGEGLNVEQVAAAEHLSVRTAKRILAELKEQLDAPTLFALGVRAAQLGLVS